MENIIIREATMLDYDTLLDFEQGVIEAERPFDSTLDDHITYYDIQAMITSPHIHLVVAENNDGLMGCGYARIEDAKPYLRHKQYAYLGFMYVQPKYRGRNVNGRIIDALKAWSASKGVYELRLEVYSGNIAAQKAYLKAGLVMHMIEMRMELPR